MHHGISTKLEAVKILYFLMKNITVNVLHFYFVIITFF